MESDLYFDGKKYISAKRASRITGYSSDYIGQLCRGEKLHSRLVGKTRYVSEESLRTYFSMPLGSATPLASGISQKIQAPFYAYYPKVMEHLSDGAKNHKSFIYESLLKKVLLGTLVFLFALSFGTKAVEASQLVSFSTNFLNSFTRGEQNLGAAVALAATSQDVSASELNNLDRVSLSVYNALNSLRNLFSGSKVNSQAAPQAPPTNIQTSSVARVTPLPLPPTAVAVATTTSVTTTSTIQNTPTSYSVPAKSPVAVQTIIQRITETPQVIQQIQQTTTGITAAEVDARLSDLEHAIDSRFDSFSSGVDSPITNVYQQIASTQRIDNLSGTVINSPTITNASISGGSITAAAITASSITTSTLNPNATTTVSTLAVGSTGTSTFAGGIDLASGCFSINGTCIVGGGGLGVGTPGGSNTQIQFNDGGSFNGAVGFVWNKVTGFLGLGTTSPYQKLSVAGNVVADSFIATSTATSTFAGGISANLLNITSLTATSTFANGINLKNGCVAINGTCIAGGSGAVSGVSNVDGTLTVSPTTSAVVASLNLGHANTFTALQQFNGNATTTGLTSTYAYLGQATSTNLAITGLSSTLLKTNASGSIVPAVAGTDYQAAGSYQAVGSYITALTGDVTASGPGSAAATLASVNGSIGTFGSSTIIPSFTVNAKGLITAVAGNAVIAPAGTLTGATLASNVVNSSLTSVGTITSGVWNGTAIALASGGTNATSFAPNSIVTSNAAGTALIATGTQLTVGNILATTTATSTFAGGIALTGSGCISVNGTCVGTAAGGVTGVSNSDGTLVVSPTSGAVVVSVNLAHANTFTGLQQFNGNASTTGLTTGYVFGAGLTSCSGSSSKLLWNASTGQFVCGVDAGSSGSGISGIGPVSQYQTGATQTLASSTTGNDFSITAASDVITFNIPTASASNRGLLASADWTAFNNKVSTSRTLTAGAGLTGGGDLSADRTFAIDFTRANTFTGLQQFNGNASTTGLTTNYAYLGQATSTNLAITGLSSTLLKTNASGSIVPAVAGTDYQAAGSYLSSAVQSIGPAGQLQSGSSITLATSTLSFNGLTVATNITGAGNTLIWQPSWSGTLNNSGLTNSTVTVSPGSGLSGGGSVALGGSTSLSLNLASANTWTGLQQFNGNASTTGLTSNYAYIQGITGSQADLLTVSSSTGTGVVKVTAAGSLYVTDNNGNGCNSGDSVCVWSNTPGQTLAVFRDNARSVQLQIQSVATDSIAIAGGGNDTLNFGTNGVNQYMSLTPTGNFGIGSTSAYQKLAVAGNVIADTFIATTTATSTFTGGISTNLLNVTSAIASSTFAKGINLLSGCFAVNGTCVGGATGAVTSVTNADGTLTISPTSGAVIASLNLANSNIFTSLQQFNGNASSTGESSGYAAFGSTGTTTITNAGSLGVGTSTPFAKLSVNAVAGLPSFVIGSSSATSFIVDKNGNVGIGTTSPSQRLSVAGAILADSFIGTTVATSSFAGGINVTSGCLAINGNCITAGTGAVSSVSNVDGTLTVSPTSGAVVASLNLASANTWTGLQQFNGNASTTGLTSNYAYIQGNNGVQGDLLSVASSTGIALVRVTAAGSVYIEDSNVNGCNSTISLCVWSSVTPGQTLLNLRDNVRSANIVASALGNDNPALYGGGNDTLSFGTNGVNQILNITPTFNVGIGTTSSYAALAVAGRSAGTVPIFALSTSTLNATSTVLQIDKNGVLAVNSFATSTFNAGINITNGCFAVNGTCVGGSGGGITSIGPAGQLQSGASITFASSTLSFNGLTVGSTITGSGNTLTWQPSWIGTLNNSGLTNSTIGATSPGSTLSFGAAASLGGTFTADLNLGHANTFTALQQFNGNASSTGESSGYAAFGSTGTTTITAAGLLGVGTTTPFAQLSVNAVAGLPSFVIGSSSATSFIVDKNGNVGVGVVAPDSLMTLSNTQTLTAPQVGTLLHIAYSGSTNARITADTFNNSTVAGSNFQARRARGTSAAPVAPNADDTLGLFGADAYGTTGFHGASLGAFTIKQDGNGCTDTSCATYLSLYTSGTTTVSATERLRVTSAGTVGIGTTTPTALLALQQTANAGDLFKVSSTTGATELTINQWGGFIQNIASSTAVNIQDGSANSVFAVDTTQSSTNAGLDITAGGSQTGNLLNFYSSGGTLETSFTGAGGLLMNISSTTAVNILNGSGSKAFVVDTVNNRIQLATTTTPTLTTDGEFVIGDDGLVGAADGRIWVRSRATTFRFVSTANTADYSEFFSQEASSSPGDVMTIDQFAPSPVPGTGSVRLANTAYDQNIIGVVSTQGTSYNNPDDTRQKDPNFANVGLLGHIAVHVSTENGPIAVGDYLTSSALYPGYAMKATQSGFVIGQAVETFTASSSDKGSVMTLVSPHYQVINDTFVIEDSLSGAATSSATFLVNQKGTGNLLQLQSHDIDRLIVSNNGAMSLLTGYAPTDSTPVFDIKASGTSAFSVAANGDVNIVGKISVGKDTAGTATIQSGQNSVTVTFINPYPSVPKVVVTVNGLPSFFYGVVNKTATGFSIQTDKPVSEDTSFDWVALNQPDTTNSLSSSSGSQSVSQNSGQTPQIVTDTIPPVVTVVGTNPATITVGTSYVDFGATVTDTDSSGLVNPNLGIQYSVDGVTMDSVSIDTSVPGQHTIGYRAVDAAGNVGTSTRIVMVQK